MNDSMNVVKLKARAPSSDPCRGHGMFHRNTVSAVCAGLVLVAVSAPGQTNTTQSATTTNTMISTASLPPVGLASTETAQVNLVNTPPRLPAVWLRRARVPSRFTQRADRSSALLPASQWEAGRLFRSNCRTTWRKPSGARTVVRAEIVVLTVQTGSIAQTPSPAPACILVSSLETYDTATGVTHALVSGGAAQGLPLNIRNAQFSMAPAR
jgi:hypothetical protein